MTQLLKPDREKRSRIAPKRLPSANPKPVGADTCGAAASDDISLEQTFRDELFGAFAASRSLIDEAQRLARAVESCRAHGDPYLSDAEVKNHLAGALVSELAPRLFRMICDRNTINDDEDDIKARASALSEAKHASQIECEARRLLELISPSNPIVREGMKHGFLDHGAAVDALAERDAYGRAWTQLGLAAPNLVIARVLADAITWRKTALDRAKRRRGPRVNWFRRDLTEWVALQLAWAGVVPTAGTTTTFGRVLAVVQRTAGFSGANLERDMRSALTDRAVKTLLSRLLAILRPTTT